MLRSLAFEGYSARAHNRVLTGKFAQKGYLVNEELEAVLDSEDYCEFGEAYLSHVRQDSTGLQLVFDIKPGSETIEDSTWVIRADNIYASSIWTKVLNSASTFRAVQTGLFG